jgi:hypothetical protein
MVVLFRVERIDQGPRLAPAAAITQLLAGTGARSSTIIRMRCAGFGAQMVRFVDRHPLTRTGSAPVAVPDTVQYEVEQFYDQTSQQNGL